MQRMDYTLADRVQQACWTIQDQLINAVKINETKKEAIENRDVYGLQVAELDDYIQRLDFIVKGSMIKLEKFRSSCLDNLERRVESVLALVMPEEQFKVRITFRLVRNKYVSEVFTGKVQPDGIIIWASPRSSNGDFIKQLISFSIVCSINLMLGATKVFMDEPFSSSDDINAGMLQPVFDMMLEAGLQVILIEHKVPLFENVEHNSIQLEKHRDPVEDYKGYVEVLSCERTTPNV